VIGSLFLFHRPVTQASIGASPQTCGDQYNALVLKAKQSLASNDRVGAITALVGARDQLSRCQEQEDRNAQAPHAVALNALSLDIN
jgi:hypothetical protein